MEAEGGGWDEGKSKSSKVGELDSSWQKRCWTQGCGHCCFRRRQPLDFRPSRQLTDRFLMLRDPSLSQMSLMLPAGVTYSDGDFAGASERAAYLSVWAA